MEDGQIKYTCFPLRSNTFIDHEPVMCPNETVGCKSYDKKIYDNCYLKEIKSLAEATNAHVIGQIKTAAFEKCIGIAEDPSLLDRLKYR